MLDGSSSRNLGLLLRGHRVRQGLSQEELAALVTPTLSVDTISKLERGLTRPYRRTLNSLCRALKLVMAEQKELEEARQLLEPRDSTRSDTNPRRHNLTAALSSFVGREQAIEELQELLRLNRLVTLTGVGGVGKSRLALRLAEVSMRHYHDGVWLVELAPLSDAALIPQAVALALGVREQADIPLAQRLVNVLQDRRVLLLLDNCEHLVVGAADLVTLLLRSCPLLTVLATSRQPLGITGERVWAVAPLVVPDIGRATAADAVLASEAVQLFIDRATDGRPHSAATVNPKIIGEVCARLDGIPLAIELAAAHAHMLGVQGIAARLNDRFRLLAGRSNSTPERHRTLRAALDWSYDLLSDAEQRLLSRLSVFAGGWTLEAAEDVCADAGDASDAVVELLESLVDKSLVLAEADQSGGSMRYRLLETVRVYARERLIRDRGVDLAADRHADYFVRLVERAEPATWGPAAAEWWKLLDTEIHNLRAALRWLIDRPNLQAAQRLGAPLGRLWTARDHMTEGRAWYAEILAMPGGTEASRGRAKVLVMAGHLASYGTDLNHGQALLQEGLSMCREVGDAMTLASGLFYYAQILWWSGDPLSAERHAKEGLVAARAAGQATLEGLCTYVLGALACDAGDYSTAGALAESSLALWQESGYERGLAIARQQLGRARYRQGDLVTAQALMEDSTALFQTRGVWPYGVAWNLITLGWILTDRGLFDEAHARLSEALVLFRDLGASVRVAECIEGFAQLAAVWGQGVRAQRLAGAAATLREKLNVPLSQGERAALEPRLGRAQQMLAPEQAADAWASGAAMPVDDSIAEALQRPPAAPAARHSAGLNGNQPLTRRERDVATLVAKGLSNRDIAGALVITERTVENHLSHIFDALGVTSRTQLATWVIEQRHSATASSLGQPIPAVEMSGSTQDRRRGGAYS